MGGASSVSNDLIEKEKLPEQKFPSPRVMGAKLKSFFVDVMEDALVKTLGNSLGARAKKEAILFAMEIVIDHLMKPEQLMKDLIIDNKVVDGAGDLLYASFVQQAELASAIVIQLRDHPDRQGLVERMVSYISIYDKGASFEQVVTAMGIANLFESQVGFRDQVEGMGFANQIQKQSRNPDSGEKAVGEIGPVGKNTH